MPLPSSGPAAPASSGSPVAAAQVTDGVPRPGASRWVSSSSSRPRLGAASSSLSSSTALPLPTTRPLSVGSMSTPAYIANTRQLLHSLEELRNSLSSRLEQLSLAIDRLRGEATEVERAVSTGSMLTGFERRSHSQFEPLPRVSLPRSQNPIISRGGVPPLRLEDDGPLVRAIDRSGRTASRRGPSPPPAPRGRPRLGLAPTNLAAVAAQPKPAVVRSRSVSLSSNDSSSSSSDEEDLPGTVGEGEFPTAPAGAAALAATVSASVSAAASSTVSDAASASAPSDELSTTDEVFPLTVPIDIDSIIRRALSNDPEDAALTFTGMRVEDRLRSSSQPVRPSMSSPRSREDLDREIHQIRRRIETARQELQRRLERGSRAADDIMSRNNALHAHTRQLWMLVARRTRLYGGSPLAFVGSVLDSPPSPIEPLPVASALRAGSNLASSRRWPANFDDASPSASPGTSPTAPTDVPATATIESTATPSFELANPRERDRRRNNGLGLGLGLNLPRNRDLTDNLFRERDTSPRTADSRLSEDDETPTYRYTPLPRSRDGNEPQFFDDFQLYLSQDDRTGSGMRGELRTSPRERERERERQREHSLEREQEREGEPARSATRAARATTPDGTDLATEEPATRRVLEGIELMMSAPNITPHMRSRLERLAERERVLLRDLETSLAPSRRSRRSRTRTDPSTFGTRGSLMLENPNSNANSNSNSNSTSAPNRNSRERPASPEIPSPWSVLERIERTRARLRELSNATQGLHDARVSLGWDRPPASRRGSDAETVVPPSFSAADVVTISNSEADDAPPPIPAPPSRLPSGHSFASLSRSAVSAQDLLSLSVPMEPTGSSGESNLSLSTSASMASNRATIANTNIERNAAASDPIKESGELAAQDWPSPPRARRPPRPYVSLLDL